ncbi:MAG: maltose/maltodextrin ABC transporter ATP-binding protein MalK [Burkholderiaceae bacterium]|nr:maltose/maltodextrin ABC transporter ATP-binding protein MalK [Burkholderiaceae bacterium]
MARDIDLDIGDGEFVVFVGPSGSGKSTLLRLIAGLEDISSGDVFIGERRVNDIPPSERAVGMVFQSYALYPHMTVAENMAFGLKLARIRKQQIAARVGEVARALQLEDLLNRKPRDLSGGQRQRVAIGRTLVREPQVFLFDEPLSNLDATLRVHMRIEIARLHQRLRATMVYVTHDQVEAMTLADKIVVLDAGKVVQVGAPLELYHYPCNRFVASFMGSPQMNFFTVTVIECETNNVVVRLSGGARLCVQVEAGEIEVGQRLALGVRPEHVVASQTADCSIEGIVRVVECLGDHTLVYLETPVVADLMTVRASADWLVEVGDSFSVGLVANRCHLFRENGSACLRHYREPAVYGTSSSTI